MIIIKIAWGLWNQMFQYALWRALAIENNSELKLDISSFKTYKLHKYSLEKLSIIKNYTNKKDIPWYENSSSNKYIDFIFQKIKNIAILCNPHHFQEKGFEVFNQKILDISDGTYLDWYFQSDKYFKKYADIIRKDFEVSIPPSLENLEMIKKIQNVNAVSLHIRRGDYIKNIHTQSLHGLCTDEYYKKSITYIVDKVKKPVFFIFSDDIEWAKDNMKTGFEEYYIDFNDAWKNYEDIRLMKNCKHHIIANSTFSWWGAWLNPSSEKIVIMPSVWFSGYTYDTSDLYPDGWIRI